MRNWAICSLASAALTLPLAAQPSYELLFEDQFEGNALDNSVWTPQIGDGTQYGIPGWGNNELQYYTDRTQNIQVDQGTLRLIARRENFAGFQYTSARIRTINNFDFMYGKVEARMKLPSTTGIWPAFWMLPTSSPYGGWASSGEIDVMESVNFADTIYGTIHHGGPWPDNAYTGGTYAPGIDFSDDFHVYSVEWEPDTIRWYVDGNLYRSLNRSAWWSTAAPDNDRAPFDNPFHLLLNVAVGGNFPGNPNGSSQFPQTLEVDWVRVYQIEQAPFEGIRAVIPGTIEAEQFDEGYPGEAHFDCDIGNTGGAFRTDTDVDIEAIPGGGFNVGYICATDWMEYSVDVIQSGTLNAVARVASPNGGGAFRLEVNDQDISGRISVPATGGWQSYIDVPFSVTLEAGPQVIRFRNMAFTGDAFNIDSITIASNCVADTNGDGMLSPSDFNAWIAAFNNDLPACDQNADSQCTPTDFNAWIANYNAGCG